MPGTHAPLHDRWARYVIMPDLWQIEGCWEWVGPTSNNGYGDLRKGPGDRSHVRAHRYSYELAFGPIPDGLVIDHLCCNTGCQNPWHMEVVTNEENSRRNNRRFDPDSADYPCGHPRTAENTYNRAHRRPSCKACLWACGYRSNAKRRGVQIVRKESLRLT